MRKLVILRGSMGCGKSTWLKENDLEKYTLCADTMRLHLTAPRMNIRGKDGIDQTGNKVAWDMLFFFLEERMKNGEFTIIDAVHSKSSEFSRYKTLAEKYRYRLYCVDFTDVPIEVAKQRNLQRPEYKQVPENEIDKVYSRFATQGKTSGFTVVKPDEFFTKVITNEPFDWNEYKNIHIFGDIHGCNTCLQKWFEENPYTLDDGYIFVGDYLDRGIENVDTFKFIYELSQKPNVLLLTGNHECLTMDTEILTEDGWKLYNDIKENEKIAQYDIDSHTISYDYPLGKIEKVSNECISIKGHHFEQHITKKHNVIYNNQLVPFDTIHNPSVFNFNLYAQKAEKIVNKYTDNLLRLIIWTVCDGTIVYGDKQYPNSTKCRVQFHLSLEDKIKKLDELLNNMGIKHSICPCKKSGANKLSPVYIRFYGDWAKTIYSIIGKDKQFPKDFQFLSKEQLDVVLHTIEQTGGYRKTKDTISWSSINKKNIDIIQIAAISNGYETFLRKRNLDGYQKSFNKLPIWELGFYTNKQTQGKKSELKIEQLPEQKVFCFNMPKGTLITRTNNTVVITGNCHLFDYAHDMPVRSKEFLNHTAIELVEAGITKSDMRQLYRKLGVCTYITFRGYDFIISHGGIPYLPKDSIDFYGAVQFIKGVGNYEDDIDKAFDDWAKVQNEGKVQNHEIYQVHGHRNIYNVGLPDYEYSYNLEDKIEFGGNLRVLSVLDDGTFHTDIIKNDVFSKELLEEKNNSTDGIIHNKIDSMGMFIQELRNSKHIQEKMLGDGISAFNFTHGAFEKGIWNNLTTQARGLFIDIENEKIQARSYNKFFNKNEREETKFGQLVQNLQFPVRFYKKYNGFLGILSMRNDELYFCSKTTNVSNHTEWFKNIFYRIYSEEQIEAIKDRFRKEDISMVFEVIDPINDPHIIKYEKPFLVLLDMIYNTIEFSKVKYEHLLAFGKRNGIIVKELCYEVNNIQEFLSLNAEVEKTDYKYNDEFIEGFVVEDAEGFMFKYKLYYYTTWKSLRWVLNRYMSNPTGINSITSSLTTPVENYFLGFLKEKYPNGNKSGEYEISTDIISERDDFIKNGGMEI